MVYIGGVIVFVVFTILLTSRLGEYALEAGKLRKIAAAFFSMIIAVLAVVILRESHSSVALEQSDYATLAVIGKRLLSPGDDGFILPFEAISLLLLISLIGAVSIARVPRDDKNKEAE